MPILLLSLIFFFTNNYYERSKIPLEISNKYSFENTDIVEPWGSHPSDEKFGIEISSEYAYSRMKSLKLFGRIDASDRSGENINEMSAGINKNFSEVKAISGWIYIPITDQSRNKDFDAHITAYKYVTFTDDNNKQENIPLGIYGDVVKIIPGVWTPVFLGPNSSLELVGKEERIGNFEPTVKEIYIAVWCYEDYNGEVYFDDILIYK